jgi:hypothetical protein
MNVYLVAQEIAHMVQKNIKRREDVLVLNISNQVIIRFGRVEWTWRLAILDDRLMYQMSFLWKTSVSTYIDKGNHTMLEGSELLGDPLCFQKIANMISSRIRIKEKFFASSDHQA